jgi:hypothetical protein
MQGLVDKVFLGGVEIFPNQVEVAQSDG